MTEVAEDTQEGIEQSKKTDQTTLTLDQWRLIFGQASENWYQKQDNALTSKRTGALNKLLDDKQLPPEQIRHIADIVYARGVMAITRSANKDWFPQSQSVSIQEALGDNGVLFMIKNLPTPDAPYEATLNLFQKIAQEKDLKWQGSFENQEPNFPFPRPAFMSTVVKKWEAGQIAA